MTLFSRLKSALDVLASLAVLVAAIALCWTLFARGTVTGGAPPTRGGAIDVDHLEFLPGKNANSRGNGKLVVVEFADYQCPFCGSYARETFPQVERELIAPGLVTYIFRHFPLEAIHPLAFRASEAAECAAEQGRHWELHERLFSQPMALTPVDLVNHARGAEIDLTEFDKCLTGGSKASLVRSHMDEGTRLGVSGTPAFFFGRVESDGSIRLMKRVNGSLSFSLFKGTLDAVASSN
jgi:NhaA family Na+:H+ antiporter